MKQDGPTIIYEDNKGAIELSKNPCLHERSKHWEMKYHYLHELCQKGDILFKHVDTDNQMADAWTKNLTKAQFIKHTNSMSGCVHAEGSDELAILPPTTPRREGVQNDSLVLESPAYGLSANRSSWLKLFKQHLRPTNTNGHWIKAWHK